MEKKTYSRARVAKAALAKLIEMHEAEAEIFTEEVSEGRFTAKAHFAQPLTDELRADLIEHGFPFIAPYDEAKLAKELAAETEEAPETEVEAMETRALAEAAAKNRKSNYIREVSLTAGPTALVHIIADSMPNATRQEVIAACRQRGIAYGTARTQYQKWFAAHKKA